MSKLAHKPLDIPEKVEVLISDTEINVKGPLGSLRFNILPGIKVILENRKLRIIRDDDEPKTRAFQGLTYAMIRNMLIGVTNGFQKQLEIVGVGYGCQLSGKELIFKLGFSHPVKFKLPENISAKVEKNIITISGIDKYLVGEIAAMIRRIKPPEPYKGTGIRYVGERIIKKAGKLAVGAAKG